MDPTSTGVLSLLEQLDDEIDDLEDSLATVLEAGLSDVASKLPLLDKAKLFVLVTYAVESILFSYLRLNGVNPREHPVFVELTRVKQYFDKLKAAEHPTPKQPGLVLDKNAAGRFIKAGLSGNSHLNLEQAERLARERVRTHIKFNNSEKEGEAPAVVGPALSSSEVSGKSSSDSGSRSPKDSLIEQAKLSKKRKAAVLETDIASENKASSSSSQPNPPKSARKKKDKNKSHLKSQKHKEGLNLSSRFMRK